MPAKRLHLDARVKHSRTAIPESRASVATIISVNRNQVQRALYAIMTVTAEPAIQNSTLTVTDIKRQPLARLVVVV